MSTNDASHRVIPADTSRQRVGLDWLSQDATATEPLPLIREEIPAWRPVQGGAPATAARAVDRRTQSRDHHGIRFLAFGAIGAGVFLAGLALQLVLVRDLHIDPVAAYIIQGIASIQLSFLLNRYVTWRDRSVSFWAALWRFNTQKALLTIINIGAYALLVRLGVQYIVANIGLTAVFTPANYLLGHYWSFAARPRTAARLIRGGWPWRAVGLLRQHDFGLAARGIRSVNDTFWGRFVGRKMLSAKTAASTVHSWPLRRTSADEAMSRRSLISNAHGATRDKVNNYEYETLDEYHDPIGRISGEQRRELDQLYHSHVSNTGIRPAGTDTLAVEEAVPGALAESYAIPAISFHYNRALILTAVLSLIVSLTAWKVVVSWHDFAQFHWEVLVVVAPVAVFKAYGWVLSIFDRPVSIRAIDQPGLDCLRVVVTVPVYNEDPTILDRCIWALVNQSRRPQRIDVVDDGSTTVDYSHLRAHWEGEHQGVEVTWQRQPNAGKRRAHCLTFKSDKFADIFVTVDSDTALAHNGLEEGLKPFKDPSVQSVAGIELGYNASYNFVTQIQNALQQLAQTVIGAAWSVTGDMYTNRGPFALYDADMVRELVPLYWGETLFGRRVVLGDDSLLALAGSMRGRSVQQLSAFGLTMWPETVDHHLRQRVRWARGRAVRNFWRVKYYPLRSYLFWYSVMGIYGFVAGMEVAYEMAVGWPNDKKTVGAALLLMVIWSWLSQVRALCIKRDGDTWLDQATMVFIRPVASLWSAVMLNRMVRCWGTSTLLKQGWTTRQQGAEIKLDRESALEGMKA